MSPRIQLALSISAIIYGFTLIAALIYGGNIASHPVEIFLGVLLLAGGMLFLWRRWAPQADAKLVIRPIARASTLSPATSALYAPPASPASPSPAAAPVPPKSVPLTAPALSEGTLAPNAAPPPEEREISDEEFLAPFLKK